MGTFRILDLGVWDQEQLMTGPALLYSVPSDEMVVGALLTEINDDSAFSTALYTGAGSIDGSPEVVAELFGDGGDNRLIFFNASGITAADIYIANYGPMFVWPGPDLDLSSVSTNTRVIPYKNWDQRAFWLIDSAGTTGSREPSWVLNDQNVVVDGTLQYTFGDVLTGNSSGRVSLVIVDI